MSEQEEQNKTVGAFPPLTNSNVPIGTVTMYAGLLEGGGEDYLDQQGWMVCDGRLLDQDKYKELHQVLRSSYGNDGAKFYIPDCQGLFVRGVDGDSENDPDSGSRTAQNNGGNTGDAVGTLQEDEFKSHHHSMYLSANLKSNKEEGTPREGRMKHNEKRYADTIPEGGSETRPKNIYMYYIIKFKTVENN